MSGASSPPPGWYQDPAGSGQHRWWDGQRWTEHLRVDYVARQEPQRSSAPSSAGGEGQVTRPLALGTLVASLLVALGCLLPWATVDLGFVSANYNGYRADGKIFIWAVLLSAVFALLELTGRGSRGFNVASIVLLTIAGIGSAIGLGDVQRLIDHYKIGSVVHAGGGLVLTVVAGLGGAVTAGFGERSRHRARAR